MMSLANNESTTPIPHFPLPLPKPEPQDRPPGHPGGVPGQPKHAPQDFPSGHTGTPAVGQTALVLPDSTHTSPLLPHCHPLPEGTLVVARHAPYSKTWAAAVVVSSRQRQGRTLYDIAWEDTSSGATSGAIPQTRVQLSLRPPAPRSALGSPRGMAPSTGGPHRI